MSTKSHRRSAEHLVLRCAIITCSDTRTPETDTSGAHIKAVLEGEGHRIAAYEIMKDDSEDIQALVRKLTDDGIDVILLNGGTGVARRDSTFDAVSAMLEKTLPGFGEIFRMLSFEDIGPAGMLSRATAGVIGRTLVFSMPGSTGAVRLAMGRLIAPELRHLVWEITEH
jgi:molybdenum cofactor biosynthesis protein B